MLNKFLNLGFYHRSELFDPLSQVEVRLDDLCRVLPRSLAELALSTEKYIDIPGEVADIYSTYRPTPLRRAIEFERAINTDCEIYVKDEGATPTGNHKANSAYVIGYLAKKDGVEAIATETTGNWGIALAMAGREFGIKVVCFMDHESHTKRPDRKPLMEELGAEVVIVEPRQGQKVRDLLTLSADAAIEFTRRSRGVYYVFGSIYGYFIIPQSVIGLEIKAQLSELDKYPDIVIGSCGGGANLMGTAGVFLADIFDKNRTTRVVSAEAKGCPILSEGRMGLYSIDTVKHYPLLKTYGIDELGEDNYVGGLGSTIVASSVAFFHSRGMIEVTQFTSDEAKNAAELFRQSAGRMVALETGYTIAAIIKQARENHNKLIVANISSGDTDKQFYD